jgi:hypothetical protein
MILFIKLNREEETRERDWKIIYNTTKENEYTYSSTNCIEKEKKFKKVDRSL